MFWLPSSWLFTCRPANVVWPLNVAATGKNIWLCSGSYWRYTVCTDHEPPLSVAKRIWPAYSFA